MNCRLYFFIGALVASATVRADYADIINAMDALHGSTYFPAQGQGLDDIESAFGPRYQSSTGQYDWHRGIDIDAPSVDAYAIVAAYDGTFYDYRMSDSGGYTVILRHTFDTPISYNGKTLNYFYTWYLHLYDDGVANNGTSTDDIISAYSVGDAITAGTVIGRVGDSGSPSSGSYAPHLHFEVRIGSNASLEYQLDNIGSTTQWGFDPHMNPMLLYEPGNYTQSLNSEGHSAGEDLLVSYSLSDDDYPNLDGFIVTLRAADGGEVVKSYTLSFNERDGYNADETELLDTRDETMPFVDPKTWNTGSTYETDVIVPTEWLAGYMNEGYEVNIEAFDIWGSTTSETFALVPELEWSALSLGLAGLIWSIRRRRG